MASFGHVAVGLAAARLIPHAKGTERVRWSIGLCALALAPDLDVIGFKLGIPYAAGWGHRGASHALFVGALVGFTVAVLAAAGRRDFWRIALVCIAVACSHGLLDALTDGGLGPALFWPFEEARHFAPVRPLPVAPIGLRMWSPRGLEVLLVEALTFLPLWLYGIWPEAERGGRSRSSSARGDAADYPCPLPVRIRSQSHQR